MADIIERLRIESQREPNKPIWRDAIDEIEALRAEVERVTCELMDATTRVDKLEAAAPELLAALVELRDWYTEHTGLPAVAANAAIAKATGEAA